MGYEEDLAYLYGLERFGMKLGLGNVTKLLSRVGNPHKSFPSIHVAGSNGKGSVCAFIATILRQAGYRVGLYTSPHLVRFNERIRVDGEEISDQEVVRLVAELRSHAEEMSAESRALQPTFFEFTTAMAFRHFQEREIDIAVVEVGMGGRLDATNVVQPEVAVVTRIELEHTQYLGRTVDRIAREKAGIIKEGVPVWTVDQPAAEVIRERCTEVNSPLRVVGRDIHVERTSCGVERQTIVIRGNGDSEYSFPLLGTYQAENAGLAFGVVRELRGKGWHITDGALRRGYTKTQWPCRLQLVHWNPIILLDVTHTPGGAERLRESLQELFPGRKVVAVVGVLEDKDLSGIVSKLAPICRELILTEPDSKRAFRVEDAAEALQGVVTVRAIKPVSDAVEAAINEADNRDVVLVTGSLYTAGEACLFIDSWKRRLALEVVKRLKEKYLPDEFAIAPLETALGKITRKTEDPFVVLISTVLSQRTADPVTEEVSSQLFARYETASQLASAKLEEIEDVVRPANFYRTKARAIREIARRIANDYGGSVPKEFEELLKLPLVGRKTANCVLVYGYGEPAIPVDVHCHRIPNRIGIIRTKEERETENELTSLLPQALWLEVNELFVRHGQTTCRPTNPACPSCNLADICAYNLAKKGTSAIAT